MESKSPSTHPTELILGSCQFPPDVFRNRAAYRTKTRLTSYIESRKAETEPVAEFALLMAGDSIYADATAGLFDPVNEIDRFKKAYEKIQESYQEQFLSTTGIVRCSTIDDHEIIDNWDPLSPTTNHTDHDAADFERNENMMLQGKRYFIEDTQIPGEDPSSYFGNNKEAISNAVKSYNLWKAVDVASAPIFLMDTRTDRESRTLQNLDDAAMISVEQFDDLTDWLENQHELDRNCPNQYPRPKFILCGSMPLPRTRRVVAAVASDGKEEIADKSYQLGSDSWDGFPATLTNVLAKIADIGIKNVFFLSGDAHIPCLANAQIKCPHAKSELTVGSIHAAPFYAPLPFANAKVRDFVTEDHLHFNLRDCQYDVFTRAEFPRTGDGFVAINNRDTEIGKLHVSFHTHDHPPQNYVIPLAEK